MAREVRGALQPPTNSRSVSTGGNFPGSSGRSGYERILLNYPHVIALVRTVMSKEDTETHLSGPIVLSNC